MVDREISQGDVYIVNLGEAIGSEQRGIRPCLILSCDERNVNNTNVLVAPITSSVNKKDKFLHYNLDKKKYSWFKRDANIVLLECTRNLSTLRFEKFIGKIDSLDLREIINLNQYNCKKFDF